MYVPQSLVQNIQSIAEFSAAEDLSFNPFTGE